MTFNTNNIKGLTSDSRKVKSGYLFAALSGATTDGAQYIQNAIDSGATHILALEGTDISEDNVTIIPSKNPHLDFAKLVSAFYSDQPHTIAAVTGTNGKTSTATFAQQLWEMAGHRAVSLGTTGIHGAGLKRDAKMTTPDPILFHETLKELHDLGITHAAIEASSHGLDQCRVSGANITAAGFTNLTQDHLDYHKTMDHYFESKLKLFSEVVSSAGISVLNADVSEFDKIKLVCRSAITSYGENANDLKILSLTPIAHGQHLELEVNDKIHQIDFPLVGRFQVMNALCALGMVAGVDKDFKTYLPFLSELRGVPGRLQPVSGHPKNAGVYIDYAHTPDALENAIKALRPHTKNRLVCIAGCGGDRDKIKRPIMGGLASENADHVIVTDDNPRSEIPADIRKDMIAGIENDNYTEATDRRSAIQNAIKELQDGDVLIIAGKGHETGQEFTDHTDHFNDYEEAEAAIKNL